MPNYCDYDMKAVGDKDKVLDFVDIVNGKYDYMEDEYKGDEKHLFRIFEALPYDQGYNSQGRYESKINGYCAWSAYSCMMKGDHTYYDSVKKDQEGKEFHGTCLEDESKNLDSIEVFSSEPGSGFQEHIVFSNGENIINECEDYEEVFVQDYETYEEYLEEVTDDPKNTFYLTEEHYNEKYKNEETLTKGGVVWEYDNWQENHPDNSGLINIMEMLNAAN